MYCNLIINDVIGHVAYVNQVESIIVVNFFSIRFLCMSYIGWDGSNGGTVKSDPAQVSIDISITPFSK